jgi:hypothetical protein
MVTEEQTALNQKTYLALGRFVVCFSHLLNSLEESTIWLFGIALDGKRRILVKAALSGRTASPIVSSFFTVFFEKWGNLITEQDLTIIKCLRKEIEDLIQIRNRIMHDAWMGKSVGGDPGPHPMGTFRVRTHGKGATYDIIEFEPEKVTSIADDAERLAKIITGIVFYHKPGDEGPAVADRFEIREKRVYKKEA